MPSNSKMRTRYQGVVTTGIYCRAGCPATPLEIHTRPFDEAAAAEASGFRPCLRCRPDRLPGPSSWVSPSELVCRALRLIADGALDTGSEDDLGLELGVSSRHLRRLFETNVGATPSVVARSRRAHLARRLLDETDLPIAEVGFASGFASVRQMNRVMREVFHFSPTELRSRRRKRDRLVADGGLDLRLPYHPPFAWELTAGFLGARAIPGVESYSEGVYRRTVRIEDHAGVIEVSNLETETSLKLRVHLPAYGTLAHVVAGVRRIFDLDADPKLITSHLSKDKMLRSLLKTNPGIRVPGALDRFELGVRAILGQQVAVAGARTLAGRLVERFGDPVPGLSDMGLHSLFPRAEAIAALSPKKLQSVGLPHARAETLRRFAKLVADGSIRLTPGSSLDSLVQELDGVAGIGPWTAQYIAMRACGQPDAFPSGDLGLRRAMSSNGALLSTSAANQRSEAWRPWRAYAAMTLWLAPKSAATA